MSAPAPDLEKDAQGRVITFPVKGFTSATIAEMSVFLQLRYAQTPEQLKAGGKAIQFALTPEQALELAAMLTHQAQSILTHHPQSPIH